MIDRSFRILTLALCLVGLSGVQADVKMPGIFGNHMVLQQETHLPIWGSADPGEKVTVSFGDTRAETTTGADGKWRVELAALPSGTPPGTLVIKGKNTLTFQDVLVGDVWVCSGQSNMAFPLKSGPKGNPIADDQIRLFIVRQRVGVEECEDLRGSWRVCSPAAADSFSAVGLYFASNLRPILNRPIGLIGSYWGGTPAQAWTALSPLKANPALASSADEFSEAASHFPGGQSDLDEKTAARAAAMNRWGKGRQEDAAYQAALQAWRGRSQQGSNEKAPVYSIPMPAELKIGQNTPSVLFNGMIRPIIPYAIKGVIWYQGEANATNTGMAFDYRTLFPTMISNWRTEWSQGDFPFLFVQLPNFRGAPKTAGDVATWAMLRESQWKTLSLPKTGMAVTIDIGNAADIHPPDKTKVGCRLALAARRVAYGEDLAYTGPIYQSMKTGNGQVQISFQPDSLGGGLVIGSKLGAVGDTVLRGFAVAGEEKQWVWAEAKIEGNTVVVFSPDVPHPVAVRYAWSDNPTCNLYNKAGLPASPFRSDEWEDVRP